jgi:hypothetical protein
MVVPTKGETERQRQAPPLLIPRLFRLHLRCIDPIVAPEQGCDLPMSAYGTKRTSRSRIVPAEVRSAGDIGPGLRNALRRWRTGADHTAHEHPTGI